MNVNVHGNEAETDVSCEKAYVKWSAWTRQNAAVKQVNMLWVERYCNEGTRIRMDDPGPENVCNIPTHEPVQTECKCACAWC